MGDGKVLEKMGERRKYVRRDATVERLSAIFLEDMVGSVKPSTLACYRRNIQCHILPALGECVAAEVTAEEINDFIQQLQEDYSPKLVREIGGLLLRIVGMAGAGQPLQVIFAADQGHIHLWLCRTAEAGGPELLAVRPFQDGLKIWCFGRKIKVVNAKAGQGMSLP